MRKQLVTVLLLMLVMALITASAQTQGAGTDAPRHAALQKVSVVRTADGVSVEIRAHGTVKPRLSTLNNPARIVVDLPNTVVATAHGLISVNGDGVKDVRLGMDGRSTPTSRIVVDLTQACRHELVSGSDNALVLKLYTRAAVAKAAPMVVKAPAAQPAVAKNEVAVAPPVAQIVAPATEAKLIQTSARATDFAFIEPSYRPKDSAASDDTKPAVVDPSARATAAAGKFAVRPEGNLLPAASAAMQSSGMQPAVNMAAEQKVQAAQAPAITGPKYTGEPISVNLKDVDLKDFFRLIHEISGLNVVLDPNVKGTLTIVLDDVPWDQALDIVLKNNDLSRQLEGNVLRIATVETMRKEAESRRAQIEAEALAVDKVTVTRFLSYAHSKDVVPTVKNFLTQRGDVISDDRTNALIIQDIPSVMPAIDRLLTQLDRKTQEVEIEARVVAATRSFARDIGTQLGFGWGDGKTAIGGASAVGTSPTTVGGLTPGYITAGSSTGGEARFHCSRTFPSPARPAV
jgi:type IV pilus assembly protein PilQ